MRNRVRVPALVCTAIAISAFIQIIGTDTAEARPSWFCEDYAHGYADRRTGNVLHSTIGGAGAGALIGGIADSRRGARRGAAIGATVGLIGGSARTHERYNRYFNRAFQRCMAWR